MVHDEIIHDLTYWIKQNLEQPLSIKVVANKSGYSQWYLQRLFKISVGQPLAAYIRHQRLNEAADELKNRHLTIAEIAYKYRFESQQSFTRAFKRHYLTTPSDYRKALFE